MVVRYALFRALKRNCTSYFAHHLAKKMFSILHSIVFLAIINGHFSLKCYQYNLGSNNTFEIDIFDTNVTLSSCGNHTCVCASYRFQCSSDYILCPSVYGKNQTIVWVYLVIDNSTCPSLIPPSYMNVTCCDTDLCNNQGMKLDTTTTIATTTTSTSLSSSIFVSIYICVFSLAFLLFHTI